MDIKTLEKALETHPDEISLYLRAAQFYRNNNQSHKALDHLTSAMIRKPGFADSYFLAGEICFISENYEEAEKYFIKVLDISQDSHGANYFLAQTARKSGNKKKALRFFRECIKIDMADSESYYFMAIIAADMNLINEAESFFLQAVKLLPGNWLYRVSYAEFLYQNSKIAEGINILEPFGQEEIPDLLNVLAKGYYLYGEKRKASAYYKKSLNLLPEQPEIRKIVEKIAGEKIKASSRKKKLVFFTRIDSFLNDIMRCLSSDYDVELIKASGLQDIHEGMQKADIAWFEWCDDLIAAATKLPKKCPIVCRLHAYEVFTDFPSQVDWSKVDRLIIVSKSAEDILKERFVISTPISLIYNGVDFNKFKLNSDKVYGKNICSVGYMNYKKNPSLMLQCFKAVHKYDPEYSFHFAGEFQDYRFKVYLRDMTEKMGIKINFREWTENIPEYFLDKDYIISASFFESFHYAIAEGICCGVLPLVHKWMGCEQFYPENSLFTTPDEFVEIIKNYEKADKHKTAITNRQNLKNKFLLETQIETIKNLLTELEQ